MEKVYIYIFQAFVDFSIKAEHGLRIVVLIITDLEH